MTDWQPELYLQFANERTQPAIDLANRIEHARPASILDVGCGPGNSTLVLHKKWPQARLLGLDSSPAMLEEARKVVPSAQWVCQDANEDLDNLDKFDIVFSNAAIQWLPGHRVLLTHLFALLNPDGVMAIQVPYTENMPAHRILVQLVDSPRWKQWFSGVSARRTRYAIDYYYNIISGLSENIALWQTTYIHIMNELADIVTWFRSTALKPYMEVLPQQEQEQFLQEFEYNLGQSYHAAANGKLMLAFTRNFFTVGKPA